VVNHGVQIMGYSDLPNSMSVDACAMYARNVIALIGPFLKDGTLALDLADDVITGALLTHQGEVRHAPTKKALEA
jgi:NAD(P) transhydrogenase subunit alpha